MALMTATDYLAANPGSSYSDYARDCLGIEPHDGRFYWHQDCEMGRIQRLLADDEPATHRYQERLRGIERRAWLRRRYYAMNPGVTDWGELFSWNREMRNIPIGEMT